MKTISDIIKKFRKEFVKGDGRIFEIEQFLTTEIKELLDGLKGEERGEAPNLSRAVRYDYFDSGYNQRESKLREDIDKILKK